MAVVTVSSTRRAGGGMSLLTRGLCNRQPSDANHDLNVKCALDHMCCLKTVPWLTLPAPYLPP